MNRQLALQTAKREAEEERIQTAIELGLNSKASWSEIHNADNQIIWLNQSHITEGIELSETMRQLFAMKFGLPKTTPIQTILSRMTREVDQSVVH
ncbi:MAG: hypothetical protein IIC02_02115 [Planctomycetes bacterium]|nr:hypothetical protein [Planctomycetota bacterium]